MELCLSVVIAVRMPVQHVHACACELEHTSVCTSVVVHTHVVQVAHKKVVSLSGYAFALGVDECAKTKDCN